MPKREGAAYTLGNAFTSCLANAHFWFWLTRFNPTVALLKAEEAPERMLFPT
jgi:hypothetical protein